MAMRSWLFVPGDSERKLARVSGCGADVVIVDLEDAVAPSAKAQARGLAGEWLRARGDQTPFACWVRINALDTDLWREDCAAVMVGRPSGLMVPKAAGPAQLAHLAAELERLEARHGIAPGTTRLLPLVSETARAALGIADYVREPHPRLAGLTWGAEDLSVALGTTRKRDAAGKWTDAFRIIRAQVLLVAHAIGVAPIDTLHTDFRDRAGLERIAAESHADGFAGMLAIHPDQVPVINAAFTPGAGQIAAARAIVAAFAAQPGAGALQLDGQMIDQPHLQQARKLLARLGEA